MRYPAAWPVSYLVKALPSRYLAHRGRVQGASIPLEEEAGPHAIYQDGPGPTAKFHILERIDVDDHGNVYVIDWNAYAPDARAREATIRTIDSSGEVRTLFRSAAPSFGGILASPQGLAVAGDGTVYLSNTGRHQILSVTREGALRVVAGTGVAAQLDGPREDAAFRFPGALALTPDGALVVVDQSDSVVRVLVPRGSGLQSGGVAAAGHQPVPRVEGVSVTQIASGTEGPVSFRGPAGMALDGSGNLLGNDNPFWPHLDPLNWPHHPWS